MLLTLLKCKTPSKDIPHSKNKPPGSLAKGSVSEFSGYVKKVHIWIQSSNNLNMVTFGIKKVGISLF